MKYGVNRFYYLCLRIIIRKIKGDNIWLIMQ
nr:MAG TPA: hypothetical protein [Crassvirales sp.]DAH00121.1 MAG TPA: hypothetical protein [Crassvirales sp.]DAL92843.1 MAG TPA: hypothetical protein [Caudoviricetes sp.]